MIPLALWLAAPKLRADADAPGTEDMRPDDGPGVELLRATPCGWCGDHGVIWHAGVASPEPCPECSGGSRAGV